MTKLAAGFGQIVLGLFLLCGSSSADVYRVGLNRPYPRPSAAAAVAHDGDVIEIEAATYPGDVAVWRQNNLTIRGVGGYAHLEAAGEAAEDKAIWVIKGDNTVIENIEFSGAEVPDHNGAGIRQEGSGLTVRNCYFHDNEDGILGGAGDILIEYSEFGRNGAGDGLSHNLYISERARRFTLRFSYLHHARTGHNVKSRARENRILYNRIMDEVDGTSSYAIDLPNGGVSYIIGNLIQHGPQMENTIVLNYGAEKLRHPVNELYVINNTFVNDGSKPVRFIVVAEGTGRARIINNLFIGAGRPVDGRAALMTNLALDNARLVARDAYDYRLTPDSPAIDAGSDPGTANGVRLSPDSVYRHPRQRQSRPINGKIDVGAYEFLSSHERNEK